MYERTHVRTTFSGGRASVPPRSFVRANVIPIERRWTHEGWVALARGGRKRKIAPLD